MKQFEKFSKICQSEYEQYAKATKNPMSYEQWLVSEAPDPKPETKSALDDLHIFDWKGCDSDLEKERKELAEALEAKRKEELRKEEEEAKAAEEILRSIRNFRKKYPDSNYEFRFSRSENFNDFLDWFMSR